MKDTQLYEQMLGLERPWEVESVALDRQSRSVVVTVRCRKTTWVCPDSRQRAHVHGYEKRRWRHLDTCQYRTIIEADVPRLKYPDGRTRMLEVPWAEGSSRFTALFERLAIDLMLCCSIKEAAGILGVSWDQADAIKSRAVKRGLARREGVELDRICIDEKSYQRGHKYLTCVARIGPDDKARVHYVGYGKGREGLDGFFETLDQKQAASIKAACVDMSQPFLSSLKSNLPGWEAKVVHDRFHLVQHMNKAVNETRRREHSKLRGAGDDRLRGTRQLWLFAEENLSDSQLERFEAMKDISLKTGRAWSIKEVFREFLDCSSRAEAAECFRLWHQWAIRSRLPAMEKVARMCKRRLAQILNYFDHRITNGPIEGLNSRIQGLIKKAFGYRNRERLKNDIFFHLGDLDLYPATQSTA